MRILHVLSTIDPKAGGVSQAMRTMVKGLAAQDVTSEVACLDGGPPEGYPRDDFQVFFLGPGKGPWLYSAELLRWLEINMRNYDAVIVHGLWQYHTYAVYKAGKVGVGNGPAVFVMPHGMLDPWFQRAKGRKLKAIRNWIFWKLVERKLINTCRGLLFTCETEKELARETFYPYNPKSESVIGLGIEAPPKLSAGSIENFRKKYHLEDKKYLLFLGRINIKKGVDLLVKAYVSLKSEGYDLPALFVAGPDSDTPYGQEILNLSSKDENILFPGMLTGEDKWAAFYGCEAFLLPSHQENFGIAVVESLACGKPVIISDQVNIWKEIWTGNSGIVSPDTYEGVRGALMQWLDAGEEGRNSLGRNATETFTSNFAIDSTAKKLKVILDVNIRD